MSYLEDAVNMTQAKFDEWYQEAKARQVEKEKRFQEAEREASVQGFKTPSRSKKLLEVLPHINFGEFLALLWVVARAWWLFLGPALILVVLFSGWYYNYSYLRTGAVSQYESPSGLPTAQLIPTDRPRQKAWSNIEWLTVEQAQVLREQDNVLNFAYLNGSSVRYAKDKSIVFSQGDPWKLVSSPPGFTSANVTGTSVQFTFEGNVYTLNVGQPFTSAQYPEVIWVFDHLAHVWMVSDDTALQSLSEVAEQSVYRPRPNGNLSLTLP